MQIHEMETSHYFSYFQNIYKCHACRYLKRKLHILPVHYKCSTRTFRKWKAHIRPTVHTSAYFQHITKRVDLGNGKFAYFPYRAYFQCITN